MPRAFLDCPGHRDVHETLPRRACQLMIRENLPERLEPQSVVVWFGETGEVGLRQETLALLSCGLYAHPDYLARHGRPTHPHELERYDWIDLLGEAEHGLILRHPHQARPIYVRLDRGCGSIVWCCNPMPSRAGKGSA